MNKVIGILLAGGMSRRYGRPKAFEELDGQPFFEIAYDALKSVCDEVVIVTRPQFAERFPGRLNVITDDPEYDGCGPLAGIYTAMLQVKGEDYIVLPCDMPLINDKLLLKLYKLHDQDQQNQVTVADAEGKLQPLVSVWSRSALKVVKATLDEEKYAIKHALNKLDVQYVSSKKITDSAVRFSNINTQEQYKEMEKWLKS